MDKIIPLRLDNYLIQEIDSLIQKGLYRNRNEGIREAIRMLINSYGSSCNGNKLLKAEMIANFLTMNFSKEIQSIILFGSVASGTATQESDIDLLVLTLHDSSYEFQSTITEAVIHLLRSVYDEISLHFLSRDKYISHVRDGFDFETEIFHRGKILAENGPVNVN